MSQPVRFADLHCHPTLRPYGQSFSHDRRQSPDPGKDTSLWHRNTPNNFDRWVEQHLGLPRYKQSSLHSAVLGGATLLSISLGSMEREFCIQGNDLLNNTPLGKWLTDSITGIGQQRIDFLKRSQQYFSDFINELSFLRQGEGAVVSLGGKQYRYEIVADGAELAAIVNRNEHPDTRVQTVAVVLSVEGMHIIDGSLQNVTTLKELNPRPFYVTFCHHFYNGLCGHALSLSGIISNVNSQRNHLGEPFTPLGVEVLKRLLDDSEGNRILIDIKHMSRAGREQYFQMMQGIAYNRIIEGAPDPEPVFKFNMHKTGGVYTRVPPALVSHGAVNGLHSPELKSYWGNEPTNPFAHPASNERTLEINFYDDEIVNLVLYGSGLFGVQLDERRIVGSVTGQRYPKNLEGRTQLIWLQIVHIVELLDDHGIDHAWDHICIGSDFDGLIDPLRGIYTYEDFPQMRAQLLLHAGAYLARTMHQPRRRPTDGSRPNRLNLVSNTSVHAETIIEKFCFRNFVDFCAKHFR